MRSEPALRADADPSENKHCSSANSTERRRDVTYWFKASSFVRLTCPFAISSAAACTRLIKCCLSSSYMIEGYFNQILSACRTRYTPEGICLRSYRVRLPYLAEGTEEAQKCLRVQCHIRAEIPTFNEGLRKSRCTNTYIVAIDIDLLEEFSGNAIITSFAKMPAILHVAIGMKLLLM